MFANVIARSDLSPVAQRARRANQHTCTKCQSPGLTGRPRYSKSASDRIAKPRRTGYPLEPVIRPAKGRTGWRV